MSGSDDQDLFEDAGPRSIFAATWFRVVLVLIVFAVIGAVSVPYILDYMNPPSKPTMASRPPLPVARPSAAAPAPAPAPQPSVPTAMPVPVQPLPPAAAAAQPTPPPAMTAQKARAAVVPAPPPAVASAPAPVVAQAQPKAAPVPAASKFLTPEPKLATKDEEKPAPKVAAAKAATAKEPAAKRTVAKAAPATASGTYWVQVGAFRDEDTARRVAAKVGGANVTVMSAKGGDAAPSAPAAAAPLESRESREPAGGADLYDVFVSGGAPPEITRRLAGKGLASEATAGGVVIRPSQPLRDAVALSKDLAVDGFKVQVRRAPGTPLRPAPSKPSAAAAPAAPASASGDTLYRVRVGPYPDRAAAMVALRDLDGKGYKGFIARGEQ